MEQRRLRLGDTLDDYCPRERRVTNHAIVAMIEEDIKQTRCTTCDAEHAYKGAKVPRRRKKETPSALFKEVLAGMPEVETTPVLTVPVVLTHAEPLPEPVPQPTREEVVAAHATPAVAVPVMAVAPDQPQAVADEPDQHEPAEAATEPAEDWPVHRPLIRAQLPRIEGQKEERRPTDFTIRQPGAGRGPFRGGDSRPKFRGHAGGHGAGNGNGNGAGNRTHGGPRFAGGRPAGPGRGQAGRGGPTAGFRGGGPPRHGGGGKKRSR